MKYLITAVPVLLVFVMVSCTTGEKKEDVSAPASLEGTWELVSYIDHTAGETEWKSYPDNVLYQKHITPTHFLWISYQKDSDQLVGMGGGTYTYDGKNYIESVQFFLPATSSILGQTISFTAEFRDGKWYHTGYAMDNEFDPDEGLVVATDSIRIEEVWQRAGGVAQNDSTLYGTWELVSYREAAGGPQMEYPDFIKYIKLITPTHFAHLHYNEDGDYISGAGTGTYSYSGGKYIENIEMLYPAGSSLTGSSITFKCEINGNRWTHFAEGATKNGQALDSVYIDELWTRYRKH